MSQSSGTGAAGAVGALSYLALRLGLSPAQTLWAMIIVPMAMAGAYAVILPRQTSSLQLSDCIACVLAPLKKKSRRGSPVGETLLPSTNANLLPVPVKKTIDKLSAWEKLKLLRPLQRYMIPLFLVYLAEYLINSGLYQSIYWDHEFISPGTQFRVFNTIYQVGVFVSRSSVNFFPIRRIWVPSVLQVTNCIVLTFAAKYQFIPSIWILFVVIFYEGLLGGLTYVNAFFLIAQEVFPLHREFSMGAASVADTFGVALAGVGSLALHKLLENQTAVDS